MILAKTSDIGISLKQTDMAIESDLISLTVEVAPSNPSRVYVSGVVGKMYEPAMERTDDGGMTWVRTSFDARYAKETPHIMGVDPTNDDRLYVRLCGAEVDFLLVSVDGAQTFTEIFSTPGDLIGFSLSPDGKHVVIGSSTDGILLASTTDHVFQKSGAVPSSDGCCACGHTSLSGSGGFDLVAMDSLLVAWRRRGSRRAL
jgi:hypothetical protein